MADTSVVFNILAKDNASGAFKKIGTAAASMLTGFAAGVGLDFAKQAIESASNLGETQSKINVLFGQGSTALNQWADQAATSLGQSKQQALDAAATFGIFGKSAGLSGSDLNNFSTNLTGLATDLASFNNTTPQQAIDAIGAALRGESEPIRAYGVLLDDASMRQEALRMGLIKTTSQALTPQQKVLAAQSLIMQQTKAAQGDFARTSGGLANQQRILSAEFENAKASLGAGLLPVMLKFTQGLMAVIGFVSQNKSWLTPLAIGVGILAAGIWVVTAAQTAWNIAMSLNPIGLIIIAVIALVAAFIYLWTHSEAFRNFFIGLWNQIWGFLKAVGSWFAGPFAHFFVDAWHWLVAVGVAVANDLIGKWNAFIGFFKSIPGKISSLASGMWDGIKNAFRGAINWIIGAWNRLHFSIPGFDAFGIHIGGFSLGVPKLPLMAVGGDVLSSGLAVIHQGERVLPAAQVRSLPTSNNSGPITMRIVGNGRNATQVKEMVRTGELELFDSLGGRIRAEA